MNKPTHLYKYTTFNENTIKLICMQYAYYSDPVYFNDPLDCQPIVENDLNLDRLKEILRLIIIKRAEKQFETSVRTLKLKGEKIQQRIDSLIHQEFENFIKDVKYYSGEYKDTEAYLMSRYVSEIESEIMRVFKRGVLCLSSKFNSPLMWSHYANQHKGICIEYDMKEVKDSEVEKVIYGGSRILKTSDIERWLENPDDTKQIERICLLTKAEEWRYENEWRMFGPIGLGDSIPSIKSIIFGLKCDPIIMYTVIKAMSSSENNIKFWKIYNPNGKFVLKRSKVDIDEICRFLPRNESLGDMRAVFEEIPL